MLAAMWLVFIASALSGGALIGLGVIPRNVIGLRGILFAPFIHASLQHLLANSIPFLILGWLVMLRDSRHFTNVTIAAMVGSGMVAWLFGAPGSVHVGASGVIFGYLGFLIVSGWYVRSLASVALSVFVTVVWGSLILGVMPGAAGISWQAHLGGFIAGVLTARTYRRRV
jgi:membrane associated rhomboid family serine protease